MGRGRSDVRLRFHYVILSRNYPCILGGSGGPLRFRIITMSISLVAL